MPIVADPLVVDASAVIALLLDAGSAGDAVAERMRAHHAIAPQPLPFEVWNVLRRRLRDASTLLEARAVFAALPIEFWPTEPLEDGIWAHAGSLTSGDAAYVSLAELTGGTLLTCDARLARAPGVRCPVLVAGA